MAEYHELNHTTLVELLADRDECIAVLEKEVGMLEAAKKELQVKLNEYIKNAATAMAECEKWACWKPPNRDRRRLERRVTELEAENAECINAMKPFAEKFQRMIKIDGEEWLRIAGIWEEPYRRCAALVANYERRADAGEE